MVQSLEDFLCNYMLSQAKPLKGCLLAAINSKDCCLSLLDESLGTPVPSEDLKLCGLLAAAGLFREEIKLTRDGRNRYRLFYLTDSGRQMAEQAKTEESTGTNPEKTKMPSP